MKNKFLRLLAIAMITGIMGLQSIYAADLTIESIYPKDGATGIQTTNQMARIVFNGDIDVKENEKYFKIVDSNGKTMDIMVLEQSDDPKRVNLLLKKDLKDSTEYKIQINGAVTDKEGNALGKDVEYTFETKSMKQDSIVTTIMMVIMMLAIVIFTVRDQAKQHRQAEEQQGKKRPEKVNPYKEAKKEAEKIHAQRQKEKRQKVEQQMQKNKNKKGNQGNKKKK